MNKWTRASIIDGMRPFYTARGALHVNVGQHIHACALNLRFHIWTLTSEWAWDIYPNINLVDYEWDIWLELVHTLKGQFEAIVAFPYAIVVKRLVFIKARKRGAIFHVEIGVPCW